jgi:hypothetical protein
MKTTKTVEIHVCDLCSKEGDVSVCAHCRKEVCADCGWTIKCGPLGFLLSALGAFGFEKGRWVECANAWMALVWMVLAAAGVYALTNSK